MNPPAPCTVTLPAHRPPASHRRPRHSACRRPANRCLEFQPAPCATIHVSAHRAPEGLAQGARRDEPRSSFACPRLSASPIQPCPPPRAMWLRAAVGLRRSAPFAFAQARASATASPRAGRAQAAHRCRAAPTRAERVAALRASVGVGARHPAASAFYERGVSPLTPFASVALRAKSAAAPPRSARTAPRPASANAFASLSPPRETSRSNLPSHRAQRRSDSAAILPLQPRHPPHASGVEGLALLAPVTSKGARRRSLATPRLGRNSAARFACPLSRRIQCRAASVSTSPMDTPPRKMMPANARGDA